MILNNVANDAVLIEIKVMIYSVQVFLVEMFGKEGWKLRTAVEIMPEWFIDDDAGPSMVCRSFSFDGDWSIVKDIWWDGEVE